MTLSNLVNAVTFTGNGVTTVFPYAFNIPDADSIEVVIYDTTTFSEVTLVEGTDYTASAYDNDAGGNVTYTGGGTPLPATQTLTIRRKPPLEQGLLLTTQSNFAPAALMDQLDKIVMMLQAQKTDLDKALIVPQGETDSPSAIMTALLAYLNSTTSAIALLGTLIPALHNTYDVGAVGTRFRNGFFQGNIRAATAGNTNSDDVVTRGAVQTLTNKTLPDYQPVAANLTSWAVIARAAGFDSFAATPSSANLRALVTDETGTGGLVFAQSPTIDSLNVTTEVQLPGGSGAFNLDTYSSTGASSGKATGTAAIFNSSRSSTGNVSHYTFANPNGTVGTINTDGSATVYNTSSDYRLKDDVTPLVTFSIDAEDFAYLSGPLRLIMLIDPVSYVWRVDPNGPRSHGFIAHELQKVFPHAVSGEKDAVIALGTVTIPEWREPNIEGPKDKRGKATTIPGKFHPEQVIIAVPEEDAADRYPAGAWTKTGERIDPQGVDYSKLVTDITAAVQALTVVVLEQKRRLDAAGL